MEWARRCVRGLAHGGDVFYRAIHRLRPVGPILFVGRSRYRGAQRRFGDGTLLTPGDPIGTLHFNNARIAELSVTTPTATGLGFARLLFESFNELARLAVRDPRFSDLPVFVGIGWLRQGARIGLIVEPYPEGTRKRYLAAHIRLLVWAFAPSGQTAVRARPEPLYTWLTRRVLVKNFGRQPEREPDAVADTQVAHARTR